MGFVSPHILSLGTAWALFIVRRETVQERYERKAVLSLTDGSIPDTTTLRVLVLHIRCARLAQNLAGSDFMVRAKYGERGDSICCDTDAMFAASPVKSASSSFVARLSDGHSKKPASVMFRQTFIFVGEDRCSTKEQARLRLRLLRVSKVRNKVVAKIDVDIPELVNWVRPRSGTTGVDIGSGSTQEFTVPLVPPYARGESLGELDVAVELHKAQLGDLRSLVDLVQAEQVEVGAFRLARAKDVQVAAGQLVSGVAANLLLQGEQV